MCPESVTARQGIRNSPVDKEAKREEWAEMPGLQIQRLLGMLKDGERQRIALTPCCNSQNVQLSGEINYSQNQADESLSVCPSAPPGPGQLNAESSWDLGSGRRV